MDHKYKGGIPTVNSERARLRSTRVPENRVRVAVLWSATGRDANFRLIWPEGTPTLASSTRQLSSRRKGVPRAQKRLPPYGPG